MPYRTIAFLSSLLVIFSLNQGEAQTKTLDLKWIPREDLNILLPASIRVYETNGVLSDGAPVRAMYALVDLRDKNLDMRAVGSNRVRETTFDSYRNHHAILAINGG